MIRCTIVCSVAIAALTVGQVSRAGTVIRGSVLDSNNQPVAEADIWLVANAVYLVDNIKGRTTTDASGQFQLDVPDEWKSTGPMFRGDCAIIAHRKETGFAAAGLGRNSPLPESVKLVLEVAREIRTTVLTADGRSTCFRSCRCQRSAMSTADSKSATYALADKTSFSVPSHPFTVTLPEELAEQFTAKSNADGIAAIPAPTLNVTVLEVESEGTGTQSIRFNGESWPDPLKLLPTGRVKGRLVSEPAPTAVGVKLSFMSFQAVPSGPPIIYGLANAITDGKGRFDVPAIAAGSIRIQTESATHPNHRLRRSQIPLVNAGQTKELEIPWDARRFSTICSA